MAKSKKDGGQINWIAVKSYYITRNASMQKTAEHFGISLSNLKRHAKEENWVAAKKEKQEEIGLKTLQRDTEKQVELRARIDIATEKMLEHIEKTICDEDQFRRHIITVSQDFTSTQYEEKFDKRDTKNMKDVVSMLKELKNMSGGQTAAELMRQQLERERFEFEKEKFEWEKKRDAERNGQIGNTEQYGVVMMPAVKEEEE